MNIPRWFFMFLSEHFTSAQVNALDQNWYRYNQISLGSSSREELLSAARSTIILMGV